MTSLIDFFVDNAVLLGSLAAISTIFGLLINGYFGRHSAKSSANEKVEEYYRLSQDFAEEFSKIEGAIDVWEAKIPDSEAPGAKLLMKKAYSIYHGIYLHHMSGNFPGESWRAAELDMKDFLSYGYIQTNITFADSLDTEFGQYMRQLEPVRRQR